MSGTGLPVPGRSRRRLVCPVTVQSDVGSGGYTVAEFLQTGAAAKARAFFLFFLKTGLPKKAEGAGDVRLSHGWMNQARELLPVCLRTPPNLRNKPGAVAKEVAQLSSPLAKGGLRGVLRRVQNLLQPLIGKKGGGKPARPFWRQY